MTTMKAVCLKQYGQAEEMYLGEVAKVEAKEKELLVKVQATALNRADIQQRLGKYPPPPGASDIMGLEVTGIVEAVGPSCDDKWKVGDRIASLLSGGGYAEYCAVPQDLAILLPNEINVIDAATIPEAWMTAYQVLYFVAKIEEAQPEYVLIHAGASSVGVAATQLASEFGAKVIVTCGSQEKVQFCQNVVGAYAAINYKEQDFVESVKQLTNGKGVGILVDCVGASYFSRNLECLQVEGRLVIIGWLGGSVVSSCDLGQILRKRIRIEGSTLRARDLAYKAALTRKLTEYCLPRFLNGRFKLFVDSVFPIQQIVEAHKYMEADKNKGKIVVTM